LKQILNYYLSFFDYVFDTEFALYKKRILMQILIKFLLKKMPKV